MRTKARPRLRLQPRRPRGRPKAEDVEALEARLVSVAREAFVLNGYGATSINAIARSARVSKNTLYARFPSKAALFRTIIARQVESVGHEHELRPSTEARSLTAALRAYVEIALARSLDQSGLEINRLILAEAHQFPELSESAHARFQIGVQSVAKIIELFAKRDRVACRDSIAAAQVFLYSVYGWYTFALATNRPLSTKDRAPWIDTVIRLFVAGRADW